MKNSKKSTKKKLSLNNNLFLNNELYHKKKIPKKVKEEVWITNFGKVYETKCYINWCSNKINVFNFHVGHNIPESKGGTLNINNLKPICDRCNLSMGSQLTITEWNQKYIKKYSIKKNYKFLMYILLIINFLIIYNKYLISYNLNNLTDLYNLNALYNFHNLYDFNYFY